MSSIQPTSEVLSKGAVITPLSDDYAKLPLDKEGIPDELKEYERWVVYKLIPRKGKQGEYDKIPYQPDHLDKRAGSNNFNHFSTYQKACSAHGSGLFDGIGFVITDLEGLVVVDIDNCIDPNSGEISIKAVDIRNHLPGYWELSPSGKGYRGIFKGDLSGPDICNKSEGVEFYGGQSARFFTVTGQILDDCRSDLTSVDPGNLKQVYDRYKTQSIEIQDHNCPIPNLLPADELPDISNRVSPGVADQLDAGLEGEDRSRQLQGIAKSLYKAGFDDQQVISILVESPGSMAVALDHRRGNADKALAYLWRHHCLPARAHRIKFENFGAKTIDRNLKPFDIPKRVFLLDSIILKGLLGSIVAPGGTSKSSLSLAMAVAVATGNEITGHSVHTQGNTWLINNEEGVDELQRRLMAICQRFNIPWETLEGRLFMNSGFIDPFVLVKKSDQGVTPTPMVDHIIKEIRKNKVTLLILDPFVSIHTVPENSNEEQQQVINVIRRIAGETGCAVLMIHHTKKTGVDSEAHAGVADDSRGASAVVAALRNAQTLARMNPATADKLGFSNEERRRMIRMDWAKSNYTLPPEVSTWYRMDTVVLPNGDPVGVPVHFDMEARCEELASIRQRDEAEKHQVDLTQILDEMKADEVPRAELVERLKSTWALGETATRKRVENLVPYGRERAVIVNNFFGQDWCVWREKRGSGSTSPVVIFRESAEVNDA